MPHCTSILVVALLCCLTLLVPKLRTVTRRVCARHDVKCDKAKQECKLYEDCTIPASKKCGCVMCKIHQNGGINFLLHH